MDAPLRLRPGFAPVRRDDRHLQLGLDPPCRAVLPDTAEVRRLLEALATGLTHRPVSLPARRTLAVLADAGLLEPAAPAGPLPVAIDAPPLLTAALTPLLGSAGLTHDAAAEVVLVAAETPVPRDRGDPLVRSGRAHLVVEGAPDGWTVGPFVVPGVTACLRCVDAHLGEADPRRGVVLEQLARLPGSTDPLGRAQALAWAVADLRSWLGGTAPGTWSASYTLGGGAPRRREWLRHPHCGCAWDVASPPG